MKSITPRMPEWRYGFDPLACSNLKSAILRRMGSQVLTSFCV